MIDIRGVDGDARTHATDALIVVSTMAADAAVGVEGWGTGEVARLDVALGGELTERRSLGELVPGDGVARTVAGGGRIAARRLVAVAADVASRGMHAVRDAAAVAGRALASAPVVRVTLLVPEVAPNDRSVAVRVAIEGLVYGLHRTASTARDDERPPAPDLLEVLAQDAAAVAELEPAIREGRIVADAVAWARDQVDAPPNLVTPDALARAAETVAGDAGMRTIVHDEAWMRSRGMGALLAVARGSSEPPRMVVLEHRSDERDLPSVAWIGKGVTFDSGGLSLKDRGSMPAMKGDMAGAAAVLAAATAVARLDLPVRLVAIAPCVENMPDGGAYRPADVVTASDGSRIEIVSTDAEGRLALADALAYARSFATDVVADVATLTGGAVVALGRGTAAAAFANDEAWAADLEAAAVASDEPIWRMPMYDAYQRAIASRVADLKNGGVREGSAGIGAVFLRRFAPERWAHVDIAGMAWRDRSDASGEEGATGYGVRLLVEATRRLATRASASS